ncbi:hypothetical protein HYW32_00765 [Candidatus Berkelbacteria bacterium]|nr:hypothetical protein [Candidatus Berkelbacteria bacterium]
MTVPSTQVPEEIKNNNTPLGSLDEIKDAIFEANNDQRVDEVPVYQDVLELVSIQQEQPEYMHSEPAINRYPLLTRQLAEALLREVNKNIEGQMHTTIVLDEAKRLLHKGDFALQLRNQPRPEPKLKPQPKDDAQRSKPWTIPDAA